MRLAAIYIPRKTMPYLFGENHDGQVINLGGEYFYNISENKDTISIISKDVNGSYIRSFWGENISLVSALVGKNGTGKTSVLRAINQKQDNKHIDVLYIFEDEGIKLINETSKKIKCNFDYDIPMAYDRNIQKQYYSPVLDYDLKDAFSSISLISYFEDSIDEYYLDSIIRNVLFLNKPVANTLKDIYSSFPVYDSYIISAKKNRKSYYRGLYMESNFANPNRGDVLINYLNGDIARLKNDESKSKFTKEELIEIFKRNRNLLKSKSFSALFNDIWELEEYKCENDKGFIHNSDNFIKNFEVTILSHLIMGAVFPQTSLNGEADFDPVLSAKTFEERLNKLLELYIISQYEFLYGKIKDTLDSISVRNRDQIIEIVKSDSLTKSGGFEVEPIRKSIRRDVEMFYSVITFYDEFLELVENKKMSIDGGDLIFDIKNEKIEVINSFIDNYKNLLGSFKRIPVKISILEFRPNKQLSTGEKSLLDFFSSLSSFIDRFKDYKHQCLENYILLLDEPELGYHPEWKKKFINAITKSLPVLFSEIEPHRFDHEIEKTVKSTLESPRIQIILTTHDPLTLSDLPNVNITYLDQNLEGRSIILNKKEQPKKSFGANITDLLADSFFIGDGLVGDFAREKIEEVIVWLNSEKRDDNITLKSAEKVKSIIDVIDEPILKTKLLEMYGEKTGENVRDKILDEQIAYLKSLKSDKY